jgi:hypothetical protein
MLMDHFKAHIRRTYPDMMHFLTYADNYAVGYFWKQGFSKEITLDRSIWAGYIKDYEGGTIMQCTMLRKVDYLDKANIISQQREAILTKIRENSRSHIVYPGLPQFQEGADANITVDPKDVPGLSESGCDTSLLQYADGHSRRKWMDAKRPGDNVSDAMPRIYSTQACTQCCSNNAEECGSAHDAQAFGRPTGASCCLGVREPS